MNDIYLDINYYEDKFKKMVKDKLKIAQFI